MSTPSVTLDVVHPAARVTYTKMPTDLFQKVEQVRVHRVDGLDDDSRQMSATMLGRALGEKGIPRMGSFAPPPAGRSGAILVSYTSQAVPQSDNSCFLFGTYQNPLPGQPVAFLVSDDTALTVETCSLHPKNKDPMLFQYLAPKNPVKPPPNNQIQPAAIGTPQMGGTYMIDPGAKPTKFPALFRYSRPIRKVIVTGYVVKNDNQLDPFRNAVGSVNGQRWLKYDIGYWRFEEFKADGVLLGSIEQISAAFTSRVNENWMSWEILFSPDIGRRVTVDPADTAALKKLGYIYDWKTKNGIIAAGLYPTKNFGALFGFGG